MKNMLARCRVAFFLLFLPLLCLSAGCRNKTDLVESELRTREKMYRDALTEQQLSEARIDSLQREVEALRKGAKITPEQAASTFGVKRVVLGRSTGGRDNDGLPGDELLEVVVEPRDEADHAIKAPGTLQIFALEVSPQGVKTPLCMWDIPAEQLHKSWKQGLLSTGYTLSLPWKVLPTTETVRVIVRLTTPDQRIYEADKDIKVRLVPGAVLKRVDEVVPLPGPPDAGPVLVPTGRVTAGWMPAPADALPPNRTQWQAGAPGSTITIGQPFRGGD
jgi:hypothetical protein